MLPNGNKHNVVAVDVICLSVKQSKYLISLSYIVKSEINLFHNKQTPHGL